MFGLLTKTIYGLLSRCFFGSCLARPSKAAPLETITDQIHSCAQSLQRSCQKADAEFLRVGERLQKIFGQSNDLTQKARRTVAQIGGDSNANILNRITQIARTSLEALERKQFRIRNNLDLVLTMVNQLHRLERMSNELIKIARVLNMVGINISIESSRSQEARENFSVLAQEIRELSITVNKLTCSFNTDSQTVQANLIALHKEMNYKIDHFQQLTATTKDAIGQATPAVQGIITRSVQALALVGEDASAISKSVSNIVISLQIHDNVSQRIDHIVKALADAHQDRTHVSESEGPAAENGAPVAAMDTTLRLEIAQLEQIVSDIENAHQVGTEAFDKICGTVGSIAQNTASVCVGHDRGTSKDFVSASSFTALKKVLDEINSMIGRGGETMGELQNIIQSASTAVSRIEQLMEHVRCVNFDMHLKSLNAMIKSGRLGDKGKSIEVLVQEMKDVAGQSNSFLEEVDGISGNIMQAAHVLQNKWQSSQDSCTEKEGRDFNAGIEEFSMACSAFEHNSEDAASLGKDLRDLILQTSDELMFVKNFAADLGVQLEQLKSIHRQIAPDGGQGDHDHLLNHREQIATRYTMQKERDIHMQILNQTANPVGDKIVEEIDHQPALPRIHATTPAALEAEVEIDPADPEGGEFDDNIELF